MIVLRDGHWSSAGALVACTRGRLVHRRSPKKAYFYLFLMVSFAVERSRFLKHLRGGWKLDVV